MLKMVVIVEEEGKEKVGWLTAKTCGKTVVGHVTGHHIPALLILNLYIFRFCSSPPI
jgi:hypothetical protein